MKKIMRRGLLVYITLLTCMLMLSACDRSNEQQTPSDSAVPSNTSDDHTAEDAHIHNFGRWVTIEEATCQTDGLCRRNCSCGEIEEEAISALGHQWSDADCLTPSTCKLCNETTGDPRDHFLENGVCTLCKQSFRTKEDIQGIIRIVNADIYRIDSAGGVSVDIGWENTSGETVKYIHFTVTAYNAVGDPVSCQIKDKYDMTLEQTGPYQPGEKAYSVNDRGMYEKCDYVWDNVWYNDTAETIEISKIKIEYVNGDQIILNEDEVSMAFSEMSLSTNAVKIEMDHISYTVEGTDGELNLRFGIRSDDEYLIKKYGTVHIKLTAVKASGLFDWIHGDVIYEDTRILNDDCYTIPYSNEAILTFTPGFEKTGYITFEIELTFTFDELGKTLTHTAICYANVI